MIIKYKDKIKLEERTSIQKAASEVLESVISKSKADFISLNEIKTALHERGFGLLMIIFALIMICMPPGLTMAPAIPIIFFSLQMIIGKSSPWIPKWLGKKKIKRSTLAKLIVKTSPHLKKVEKLLRPRLSFAASATGEKVIGIFSLLFAISIAIPLPLTNFLPAIAIILMSLGMMSKDGVPIIIGILTGVVGTIVTIIVLLFGKQALIATIDFIKNLF